MVPIFWSWRLSWQYISPRLCLWCNGGHWVETGTDGFSAPEHSRIVWACPRPEHSRIVWACPRTDHLMSSECAVEGGQVFWQECTESTYFFHFFQILTLDRGKSVSESFHCTFISTSGYFSICLFLWWLLPNQQALCAGKVINPILHLHLADAFIQSDLHMCDLQCIHIFHLH